MKKTFKFLFLLVAGMMMLPAMASAQQMPPVPVDQNVKIGTLPNGMTYYIRHNDYPKGQADFFIAQKVGSILEEDNQRGLAHFLEHMCFNGTKNFPGNQVVSWLESVGVKFGRNLNAYTSIDETVYNISSVPTERESVQDSCLLILHDWANDLLLADEEIDKERGVIHSEWLRSMVGQMRILEKILPEIYPGDRYGYRLPIGTIDVIDNFPYQAIRDYYEAWYRPDQQGIIVVGDIDVDRIEKKIIEMFSPIEMPANAPERVYYPVSDNKGTIYAVGSDKEQSNAIVQLMIKQEAMPDEMKGTVAPLVQDYMTSMITYMLNTRFGDIAAKPDAPFAQAGANYGEFFVAKTKDALTVSGVAKGDDIKPALASIYREVLRAKRGGFTASEYDRARKEYLSRLETQYKNRDKVESTRYAREYVKHFIDKEPIPGIEFEYQMMPMLVNQIPVDAINMTFAQMITDDNRIVMALLPEKEGLANPTDEELDALMKSVDAETIEAYADDVKTEPLIPQLPAAGKIVSEKENPLYGTIEWTLSNGAKVIIKKTAFKDDEILFSASSKQGTSIFGEEKANDLIFMPYVMQQTGLGNYTNTDLQKYAAGKQFRVSPTFDDNTCGFRGFSTPKDIQSLMEVIYMSFTALNVTEDEYAAMQNMYVGALQNQEVDPQYIFQKSIAATLYNSPRKQAIDTKAIKAADRQSILDMAHALTANAADFTFAFVGNVDIDALRPLVEQYIASLPGDASKAVKEFKFNDALKANGGTATDTFTAKMQTPQTYAAILCMGEMPYTSKNAKIASIAGQILTSRLIASVREREGAVYSISASGSLGRIADGQNCTMQSVFPMKPEMKDKVLSIIATEFDNLTKDITEEELKKVQEYMVKNAIEAYEKNGSWLSAISGYETNGVDSFNASEDVINAITVADVQDFVKQLLAQKNYRVIILDPEVAE